MGTVTGVISPRNQWSDPGPLLITGFSGYLPGVGMIDFQKIQKTPMGFFGGFCPNCKKKKAAKIAANRKVMFFNPSKDWNTFKMWWKVSPSPFCVFFVFVFWLAHIRWMFVVFWGFGHFLRGSPDIFPHGWQKSTCKGGHLDFISGISGTVKQLIPVIFDDPW